MKTIIQTVGSDAVLHTPGRLNTKLVSNLLVQVKGKDRIDNRVLSVKLQRAWGGRIAFV